MNRHMDDGSLLEQCALMRAADSEEECPCVQLYEKFCHQFGGHDKNPSRFNVFMNNVRLVYRHNNDSNNSYKLALNQFSGRLPSELPRNDLVFENTFQDSSGMVWLKDETTILNSSPQITHPRRLRKEVKLWEFQGNSTHLKRVVANISRSDHVDSVGETPSVGGTSWDRTLPRFDTSLNWASMNNPDGVSIVLPPPQQGICGACWAWVATGTLEASIARHQAYDVCSSTTRKRHQQRVEQQSLIPLSVQELIDCDTRKNRGCVGGNPVFAYPYLHQHGITTAQRYRYLGYQGSFCRLEPSIAKVKAWGLLPRNQPKMLKLVLQHIGPVAIAINGLDPTFLHYKSGIYDNPVCQNHKPNHVVLLVGYGEEQMPACNTRNSTSSLNGTNSSTYSTDKAALVNCTIRYWIIRNSWGTAWGEGGYMRIKRVESGPGICRMYHATNVAIGGYLLPNVTLGHSRLTQPTQPTNATRPAPVPTHSALNPAIFLVLLLPILLCSLLFFLNSCTNRDPHRDRKEEDEKERLSKSNNSYGAVNPGRAQQT